MRKRVLIVQYAGDYRECYLRLTAGGPETYASQRYSIESVASVVPLVEQIAILVLLTGEKYDEVLPSGVRALGAGFQNEIDIRQVLETVEHYAPSHVIFCTPNREVLRWAKRKRIPSLAIFADSFRNTGVRARLWNFQLARILNDSFLEWAANHNMNASRSLKSIGVSECKIVPWDWEPAITPAAFEAKQLVNKPVYWLFFAGAVVEEKGVGDIIDALGFLKARGMDVRARIAGKGDINPFMEAARALDVADRVKFLGMVPNGEIPELMHAADAVVVPSRHSYPEGLPMTIYEALCSRTPLVASDHPMFRGSLKDGESALIFKASSPESLADCVQKLFRSGELYAQLSESSARAWERIQIPVKFRELLQRWIAGTVAEKAWIAQYALSTGRYDLPD